MNKRNSNLIIAVLLIALIGIAGWLFYSSQNKKQVSKSTTTNVKITQAAKNYAATAPKLSAKSVETLKSMNKTEKALDDKTLVTNTEFDILALPYYHQFIVRIKKNPYAENKAKVETWFKDKGFTAKELCLLNISFVSSKEVELNYTPADSEPTGCT